MNAVSREKGSVVPPGSKSEIVNAKSDTNSGSANNIPVGPDVVERRYRSAMEWLHRKTDRCPGISKSQWAPRGRVQLFREITLKTRILCLGLPEADQSVYIWVRKHS